MRHDSCPIGCASEGPILRFAAAQPHLHGGISGHWRAQDGDDPGLGEDRGVAVAEAEPKLKKPPMYKVILLNDDYTPMEFVVHVLEIFFGMNREKATQVMLAVHTQGSAVVGIFPRDIAETKSEQLNQYAQDNQHPLVSRVEMTD